MAKTTNALVLDAALDYIAQSNSMIACSAEPTTYTEATVTYALADTPMTPVTDYTKAAGDGAAGSRKVTVAAKAGVTIDTSGDVTHAALVKTGSTELVLVTTVTTQTLTSGGTVDFPAWDAEFSAPV